MGSAANGNGKHAKCIHHSDRPAYSRGLCESCYHTLYRRITDGETTFAESERNGVCLPRKLSPVTRAILAAKEAKAKKRRARA